MTHNGEIARILRRQDGTRVAAWGGYELYSAFQPIFSFEDDGKLSLAACECLLRPFRNGTPVSPHKFFQTVPRDERAEIETVTRHLHLLNAGAFVDRSRLVFVNFDPSQFATTQSVDDALRSLRLVISQAGLEPARIVCELTEQKSPSPQALKSLMQSLRKHGFRIAVDDFGAEESDFERIVQMNPDIVKFDAGWVIKLLESAAGYTLLKSTVGRINGRGIQTVIEGVEETWQLELIEKTGALMVQGFGVGRPQLASAAISGGTPDADERPAPAANDDARPFPEAAWANASRPIFGRRR